MVDGFDFWSSLRRVELRWDSFARLLARDDIFKL